MKKDLFLLTVSEVSLHGWLWVSSQLKYHGGKVWQRKAAHFITARKQREGERDRERERPETRNPCKGMSLCLSSFNLAPPYNFQLPAVLLIMDLWMD
jgi:hypothetical protein